MELKSSSSSTRRNSFHGVGAAAAAATGGGGSGRGGSSVFEPTFSDPLCSQLNLTSASEFVRSSFPMATLARSSSSSAGHGRHHHEAASTTTSSTSSSSATSAQRRRGEPQQQQQQAMAVPATPGRPLQFFTSPAHHHQQLVAPRRSVPSKWEDAEKWLRQSSDSDHGSGNGNGMAAFSRQRSSGLGYRGGAGGTGGEDEKRAAVTVRRSVDALRDAHSLALYTPPAEVLLKGELRVPELVLRAGAGSEWLGCRGRRRAAEGRGHGDDAAGQLVPHAAQEHVPGAAQHSGEPVGPAGAVHRRRDGHLGAGGLELGVRFDAILVNWSFKEEDEEMSKSLRHFEATVSARAGASGVPACDKRGSGGDCRWDDDDRAKSCIRYQREEAKIEAWINLESAKAETQSRKLEVKIQIMRSNLEEKLMRRMTTMHRRAEEWSAMAQLKHLQQLRRAAAAQGHDPPPPPAGE